MKSTTVAQNSWIVTPDRFLTGAAVTAVRAAMERVREEGATCGDVRAVRNAAIVEALLGSGLRVSEVCALVVGDIFLEDCNPQILVRRGKGGKRRLVPISTKLAMYLLAYVEWCWSAGLAMRGGDPLFRGRGCHITRSAVHRIWKDALVQAGLSTGWGVHATRHSYAVEVYRKTKDLRLTQRLLGHSSPVVTTVYANLLDDDVRRGVEAVWA
jgi:site-specific recombinase XerD